MSGRDGSLSGPLPRMRDRKSTRLNSSHGYISYAVFCLKKKKIRNEQYNTLLQLRHDHTAAIAQAAQTDTQTLAYYLSRPYLRDTRLSQSPSRIHAAPPT